MLFIVKKKYSIIIALLVLLLTIILLNNRYTIYDKFISSCNQDIVIMTTMLGKKYAERISDEILNINKKLTIRILNVEELTDNCDKLMGKPKLIIARAASAYDTKWIRCLKKMEQNGVNVINPTNVLQLTSNKLKSSIHFLKKKTTTS